MSYDQDFYRQQNPAPAPREPKSNVKWFIIGGIVLVFISLLAYGAVQLGKKFGKTVGEMQKTMMPAMEPFIRDDRSKEYTGLTDSLKASQAVPDSIKHILLCNLDTLQQQALQSKKLARSYEEGYNDTLRTSGSIVLFDKKIAPAYFIKTGRAEKLKNVLWNCREKTYAALPDDEKDVMAYNMITVYKTGTKQSWEKARFGHAANLAQMNITVCRIEVVNYESKVLAIYRKYIHSF